MTTEAPPLTARCPSCHREHKLELYPGDAGGTRRRAERALYFFVCPEDGTPYGCELEGGIEYKSSRRVEVTAVELFCQMLYGAPFA